jgi:hypothetical protein
MLHDLIREQLSAQVLHDLVHAYGDPPIDLGREGDGLHSGVDRGPLPLPVVPDAVSSLDPATLPPIGPGDGRMQHGHRTLKVTRIEGRVAATQQRFRIHSCTLLHSIAVLVR